MSRALELSDRLYRGLLRAYPAEYRGEYGAEMAQVFRDECQDTWSRRGVPGLAGLGLKTFLGLGASAAELHLEILGRDLVGGLRMLRQQWSFTLLSVLVLALGIGATTALFSVVDAVLLRPLPFADADRLVFLEQQDQEGPGGVSYPNFLDWRQRSQTVEGMAVFLPGHFVLGDPEQPERLAGAIVSAQLFPLIGATARLGRTFLPEEDLLGHGRAVVISQDLWKRRFSGDLDVVGRPMRLDGVDYTIVGVLDGGMTFPVQDPAPQLWVTVAADAEPQLYGGTIPTSRGYPRYVAALAKLKPGIGPEAARQELSAIASALATEHPDFNQGKSIRLTPALDWLTGDVRQPLGLLFAAVGCVLLIACVNVANLQLARSSTRGREMAVRVALGATRPRLVRQLLTESLLLALLGGALGIVLALNLTPALAAWLPEGIPRGSDITIEGRTLFFALAVTLATGLAFGLTPALRLSTTDLTGAFKSGGGSVGAGTRLRKSLVAAEVGLATVLLIGAALLAQSYLHLNQVDPGFGRQGVLSFRLDLPESAYPQGSATVRQFFEQLRERLQTLPGVRAASLTQHLPLSGQDNGTSIELEGVSFPERQNSSLRFVGVGYFEALGIPVLQGRGFDATDGPEAPARVVVNDEFARRFLGDRPVLGQRLQLGWGGEGWKEILGVVGDVRHGGLGAASQPEVYVPVAQFPLNSMTVLLRTEGEPRALASQIAPLVRELDRTLPVYELRTLEEISTRSIAQPRFQSLLLGFFALTALLLAAGGIYGVTAYGVTQRTREIGLRLALGATPRSVLGLIVSQGMGAVVVGLVLGSLAALLLHRLLDSLLYGVSTTNPATFAAAALALGLIGLAACLFPARRAMRIPPQEALRCD